MMALPMFKNRYSVKVNIYSRPLISLVYIEKVVVILVGVPCPNNTLISKEVQPCKLKIKHNDKTKNCD